MKIERLALNKIKVTLSKDDLTRWNIDIDRLSYNTELAEEMFWNMLHIAELETGFKAVDAQLIIEAASTQNDDFVIFITKVEDQKDYERLNKLVRSKAKIIELRAKRKLKMLISTPAVFVFSDFDELCTACKQLVNYENSDCSLHKYKGRYYLCFDNSIDILGKNVECILKEYGNIVREAAFSGLLTEYGEMIIANNAIEILAKHF